MVEPILGNPLLKKFSDLGICLLSPPLTHKKQDFLGGLNTPEMILHLCHPTFLPPNFAFTILSTKLCLGGILKNQETRVLPTDVSCQSKDFHHPRIHGWVPHAGGVVLSPVEIGGRWFQ